MALEMFRIGRGIMCKTCQRVIDPLRGKRGQRAHTIQRQTGAVHDVIVRCAQIGYIEYIAQGEFRSTFLRYGYAVVMADCEMHRDGRIRNCDGDGLAMIFNQQADLLGQVIPEQFRSRDRRGKGSGRRHMTEGQSRIDLRIAGGGEADFRIKRPDPHCRRGAVHCLLKVRRQKAGRLGIKVDQPFHGRFCICELFCWPGIGR